MGTDIHFYVERLTNKGWESVDEWEYDEEYDYWEVPFEKKFYCNRNYTLFAALADVRNGIGFAGIITGERIKPICAPRGLPDDLSEILAQRIEVEHTPSWLTLEEILAYDWSATVIKYGLVDLETYFSWKESFKYKKCSPDIYCGDIISDSVIKINEEEAENHRNNTHMKNIYVKSKWEIPLSKCCEDFLNKTIPKMLRVGKPDSVRAVFYFDS